MISTASLRQTFRVAYIASLSMRKFRDERGNTYWGIDEDMEYIELRKVGREGLKEIRRQVVRLKELGKTGKETVDIGADAGIYSEGIPQNHQRADAVGLHEALGYELPAPGEACAETEPSGHLKVEKRGISRCFEASESGKRHHLLGR